MFQKSLLLRGVGHGEQEGVHAVRGVGAHQLVVLLEAVEAVAHLLQVCPASLADEARRRRERLVEGRDVLRLDVQLAGV